MSAAAPRPAAPPALIAAAPWVFVLLWSTGFIGARYGLPHIEPFTFLAIRFLIVCALLLGLILALRAPWPASPAQVGHTVVVGLLLQAGYLGGVFYAIDRGMPAGLSALIVSTQPILTAVLAPAVVGERASRAQWLGLLLGIMGVALVVGEKLLEGGALPAVSGATMAASLLALACTTGGTLYQKRFGAGTPLLSGALVQFAAAALVMGGLALGLEQRAVEWAPGLVFAMAWLVLVLSLGAILLLMLLLRASSATSVSGLFYLVPPATALEAYLLFGERLGPLALAGMALASLGVALVIARPRG